MNLLKRKTILNGGAVIFYNEAKSATCLDETSKVEPFCELAEYRYFEKINSNELIEGEAIVEFIIQTKQQKIIHVKKTMKGYFRNFYKDRFLILDDTYPELGGLMCVKYGNIYLSGRFLDISDTKEYIRQAMKKNRHTLFPIETIGTKSYQIWKNLQKILSWQNA